MRAAPCLSRVASVALLRYAWRRAGEGAARRFPDSLAFPYPTSGHSLERDFKWLGNHRYGIIHMRGHDAATCPTLIPGA